MNELKQELVASSKLGIFDIGELRLFYLGRELKNGGRTLENLGVGSREVNVIHVHPAKSASATWKAPELSSHVPSRGVAAARPQPSAGQIRFMHPPVATAATSIPIVMAGFNPTALGTGNISSLLRRAQQPPPTGRDHEVIEIGDDDEVKVGGVNQPRVDGANLLASLRSAVAPSRNNNHEVVNIDDDHEEDDDDDSDDCVVLGTVDPPEAKRQRYT